MRNIVSRLSGRVLMRNVFFKPMLQSNKFQVVSGGVEIPDPDLLFASDDEKTFEHQSKLPSLPVPDLHHTLNRYLDSVKPHVTTDEYRQTEFIVQQFASGVGKDLHKKLLERAKTQRNWLEKWWEEKAYLELGIAMAPLMNLAGPAPYEFHYWKAQDGTQLERAGFVCHYTAKFWQLIRKEKLKADTDNKGRPLCMNQMRRSFSTCRVPGSVRDQLLNFFKTESEGEMPVHVVVLYNGRIFWFNIADDNEEPLTAPEIQHQLQIIKNRCDQQPAGIGLGTLTADKRDSWANIRSRLLSLHPDNFHHMKKIETSLFCIVLDDYEPKDQSDNFWYTMGGLNPKDRWFDKSSNLIFYKNGICSQNCDHAPFDGMAVVLGTYYIDLHCIRNKGKWMGSQDIRKLDEPQELKFHTDSVILDAIQNVQRIFIANSHNLVCKSFRYKGYGKKKLRKFNLHPDTHVQLALQYVYYKMHGRPAPTYETATIRRFYHARTETMRSCTTEAVEFSKAMCSKNTTVQDQKILYMKAAARHNQLMEEAKNFNGCDRHLLGLYAVAEEEGIPTPLLFQDAAFTKSGGGGNFALSTSFVGYTSTYGGVAPMMEDGYGTFYHMEQDYIEMIVTSWKSSRETSAVKLAEEIQNCLNHMEQVVLTPDRNVAKL